MKSWPILLSLIILFSCKAQQETAFTSAPPAEQPGDIGQVIEQDSIELIPLLNEYELSSQQCENNESEPTFSWLEMFQVSKLSRVQENKYQFIFEDSQGRHIVEATSLSHKFNSLSFEKAPHLSLSKKLFLFSELDEINVPEITITGARFQNKRFQECTFAFEVTYEHDANDLDADGVINSLDCEPNNPNAWQNQTLYLDEDGDGYGTHQGMISCIGNDIPMMYSTNSVDCDDSNWEINPGALDIPGDGIDRNCDGIISDDTDGDGIADNLDCAPFDATRWEEKIYYTDLDLDLFGDPNSSQNVCVGTPDTYPGRFDGLVLESYDCDDQNPDVHPNATEVTGDGIDNDCDGTIF